MKAKYVTDHGVLLSHHMGQKGPHLPRVTKLCFLKGKAIEFIAVVFERQNRTYNFQGTQLLRTLIHSHSIHVKLRTTILIAGQAGVLV